MKKIMTIVAVLFITVINLSAQSYKVDRDNKRVHIDDKVYDMSSFVIIEKSLAGLAEANFIYAIDLPKDASNLRDGDWRDGFVTENGFGISFRNRYYEFNSQGMSMLESNVVPDGWTSLDMDGYAHFNDNAFELNKPFGYAYASAPSGNTVLLVYGKK